MAQRATTAAEMAQRLQLLALCRRVAGYGRGDGSKLSQGKKK